MPRGEIKWVEKILVETLGVTNECDYSFYGMVDIEYRQKLNNEHNNFLWLPKS